MRSSRRGHGVRKVSLGILLAVIVAVGAIGTVRSKPSAAEPATTKRYQLPAGLPSRHARTVDPLEPRQVALATRDDKREHLALGQVRAHTQPFLADGHAGAVGSTLVVTARPKPYELAEVARLVPAAFERLADGALLLKVSLLVAPDAVLVVDSKTVPTLLLSSSAKGYATIDAIQSTLTLQGHVGRMLAVRSYDPTTGRADENRHDGRAYVRTRGGELNLRQTNTSELGFPFTGATSGVAWTAKLDHPATGGASNSTFVHNYFGAYSAGAEGLVIDRSAFLDNTIYGFDPHTATNHALVTDSAAALNGRHGFIFSEGCDHNVVRDSESFLNGGTGFMIDDGTPEHGLNRTSNDNALIDVSAHDNGDVGIVIEGGKGNSVEQSDVSNNGSGIWVRNQAAQTQIVDNRVSASRLSAVHLGEGLGTTQLTGNEITGATVGADSDGGSITIMTRNRIADTTAAGLRLDGDQRQARFTDVVISEAGSHAVDVRGMPLSKRALAGIDSGSVARAASWTLTSLLHDAVVLLWAAILVLPLLSRLPLLRRRLSVRFATAGATAT